VSGKVAIIIASLREREIANIVPAVVAILGDHFFFLGN
jgi:hypothetical protein